MRRWRRHAADRRSACPTDAGRDAIPAEAALHERWAWGSGPQAFYIGRDACPGRCFFNSQLPTPKTPNCNSKFSIPNLCFAGCSEDGLRLGWCVASWELGLGVGSCRCVAPPSHAPWCRRSVTVPAAYGRIQALFASGRSVDEHDVEWPMACRSVHRTSFTGHQRVSSAARADGLPAAADVKPTLTALRNAARVSRKNRRKTQRSQYRARPHPASA
jgi:hypothetical protein